MHDKFDGFHKIIHMGGDEVAEGVFEQMPSCRKFIEENNQIQGATWG